MTLQKTKQPTDCSWLRTLSVFSAIALVRILLWSSIPILIAVIALWVRSHSYAEHLAHHSESGSWSATNARGLLNVERIHGFVSADGWEYKGDIATGPIGVPRHRLMTTDNGLYASYRSGHTAGLYVRHRTIVALLAATPIAYLFVWSVRRWRRNPGHCRKCGYDLRASHGRCPECGWVAGNKNHECQP